MHQITYRDLPMLVGRYSTMLKELVRSVRTGYQHDEISRQAVEREALTLQQIDEARARAQEPSQLITHLRNELLEREREALERELLLAAVNNDVDIPLDLTAELEVRNDVNAMAANAAEDEVVATEEPEDEDIDTDNSVAPGEYVPPVPAGPPSEPEVDMPRNLDDNVRRQLQKDAEQCRERPATLENVPRDADIGVWDR